MDGRDGLIRKVKQYAAKFSGPITLHGLSAAQRVRQLDLYRCFPGGITQLLKAARLTDRIARLGKSNSGLLMEDLDRVVNQLGRPPTWMELTRLGRYSPQTYYQRWGKHRLIIAAYEQWKLANAAPPDVVPPAQPTQNAPEPTPDLPPEPPSKPTSQPTSNSNPADTRRDPAPTPWVRGEELTGQPLGFRGLMHAPTSENGVIHLFGLLGPELGIAVESIVPQFPDCRALRLLPGSGGKWKRLAIEFELLSSNFKKHGHDPAKCDIIVCWEDDWADCPIEVIELKRELRSATAPGRRAIAQVRP